MKRKKRQARQTRMYLVAAGIAIITIAAVLLVVLNGTKHETTSAVNSAASPQIISPADYQSQFTAANVPHLLVDVRTPEEFAAGHIPGAVNIAVETLESRLEEIPTDQPVVVYCRSGNRSATAADILVSAGYNPVYDLGGIINWTTAGLPVQ